VCRLVAYGVTNEHYCLVMERCTTSLRLWRQSRADVPTDTDLTLYLRLFDDVLDTVGRLHDVGVVHYDLKCDNVLMRSSSSSKMPHLCLADFGESTTGRAAKRRPRGTECIKSPEQLLLHSRTAANVADRRRRREIRGGDCAADVWSLGCLLFELLSGTYLFAEAATDWPAFFTRVTASCASSSSSYPFLPEQEAFLRRLFSPSARAPKKRDLKSTALDFFRWVMARRPDRRPSVRELRVRFRKVFLEGAGGPTGQ